VDAPVVDQAGQPFPVFGPNLEVVLEDDVLAVEHEAPELRVLLERFQQPVDGVDEAEAEVLEGRPPLAVPVRVVVDDHEAALGELHRRDPQAAATAA
jgi:hypothetical protein